MSCNTDPEDLRVSKLKWAQIEQVPHYTYLDIWIDDKLSFKKKTLKNWQDAEMKIGFIYMNKSSLTLEVEGRLFKQHFSQYLIIEGYLTGFMIYGGRCAGGVWMEG